MTAKPLLDDVLIYTRASGRRGKANFRESFQVGAEAFDSVDAALSTADKTARQRRVSVWIIDSDGKQTLMRSFRPSSTNG